MERPSSEEYYMSIAHAVAQRGTCSRAKVGAIVVVGDVVAATGYNGSPRGTRHCDHRHRDNGEHHEWGDMENGHCSRAVHAETNVIANAARSGAPLLGGTMYVTTAPCYRCAPLVVQVGIKRVVYATEYAHPNQQAFDLLREAGVDVVHLKK